MIARDRRALFLGAGAIVAAVTALRVVPVTAGVAQRLRDRVATQEATLANARQLLASHREDRDSLQIALGRLVALAPKLIAGRTPTDAAASLASALEGLAARHAVRVTHLNTTPDSAGGPVRGITAYLELEGDVRGLTALLAAIETGLPVLTVRSLTVTAPEPGAHARGPERLRIALTVTGWYFHGDPA